MAADSSAAVIVLLLRNDVEAGLGVEVAGENTASAAGTEVLPAMGAADPVLAGADSTRGSGGASLSLSQAVSVSATRQQAATVMCFGIGFPFRTDLRTMRVEWAFICQPATASRLTVTPAGGTGTGPTPCEPVGRWRATLFCGCSAATCDLIHHPARRKPRPCAAAHGAEPDSVSIAE